MYTNVTICIQPYLIKMRHRVYNSYAVNEILNISITDIENE